MLPFGFCQTFISIITVYDQLTRTYCHINTVRENFKFLKRKWSRIKPTDVEIYFLEFL
jgi:hypothetical protein